MGEVGAKIQDGDLRAFAESGPPAARETVIVELEPTPTVRPPESRDSWLSKLDYRSAIESIEGFDDGGQAMDQLQRAFEELELPEQPVRLDSAQAFVVDVTPDQLRMISSWDLVGPIRPNKTHYGSPMGSDSASAESQMSPSGESPRPSKSSKSSTSPSSSRAT
jgi:hypothetical protein